MDEVVAHIQDSMKSQCRYEGFLYLMQQPMINHDQRLKGALRAHEFANTLANTNYALQFAATLKFR
eukprot:3477045-Amphidinium_carterae.1